MVTMKKEKPSSQIPLILYCVFAMVVLFAAIRNGVFPSESLYARAIQLGFWIGIIFFGLSAGYIFFGNAIRLPIRETNKPLAFGALFVLVGIFLLLILKTPDTTLELLITRVALVLLFAWMGSVISWFRFNKQNLLTITLLFVVLFAAQFQVYNLLKSISDYPFSMEWSETSRYYYASLPFSESLYGTKLPWAFMHPSRYIMLSMAFLFNSTSLIFHRIWQAGLSIALPFITAFFAVRRSKSKDIFIIALLTGWGFLFLNHGPVYYHLLVSAVIVLAGIRTDKPRASLVWVMVASAWAGISRINWFPLPGILAAVIYLLEIPWNNEKGIMWNLRWPGGFALMGLATSLLAQLAYVPLSGNSGLKEFGSAFFSDLLWYRLWPNVNFPAGIVPGIVAITILPLAVVGLYLFQRELHLFQRFLLSAALSVFFFGGLVVSVKIGGGSNLHNMDAFLLLVLVIICYAAVNINDHFSTQNLNLVMKGLLTASVAISVVWQLSGWVPKFTFFRETAMEEMQKLEKDVTREAGKGKEVLFISQRHFLTFGMLSNVPLIEDYELLTVMEMAMSKNRTYLDRFQADLKAQRFGLIVAYKQYDLIKGDGDGFAEENNAWVTEISRPLLEYYTPITWLRQSGVQIYAPKK